MIRYLSMGVRLGLGAVLLSLMAAAAQELPAGEGQDIVRHQCGGCHALKVVTSKKATKRQWTALVDQMITRGAEIEDEDIDTVVQYLAKNFPPEAGKTADPVPVNVNKATAKELAATIELSQKESEAIVHYREQNGDFKSWHDLANVPGVDSKKIEACKDKIAF